jgi:hypothetical protein
MTPVTRRGWLTWSALMALALALQYHGLLVRRHGVPDIPPGSRPREIALHEGVVVHQTFRVHAEGMRALTVDARAPDAAVEGEVVLLLETRRDDELVPVYRVVREAREAARAGRYTWRFPEIDTPRLHDFRLTITAPTVPSGSGLTLYATRAPTYAEGRLDVSGLQVWGDLVFGARARGETVYARLAARLRALPVLGWPGVLPLLVALYNAGLGACLWLACSRPRG